jgi:ParB-like chromosome segregation protein Spo0J
MSVSIPVKFEDKIDHVSGNLYKVDYGVIKFSPDEFNPREFGRESKDSQRVGTGFDKESLRALEDTICDKGLFKPLICRFVKQELQIVAGCRSYCAITNARKKRRKDCLNVETEKKESYKTALAKIEVRIMDLDDDEARSVAWVENSTSVPIGDVATVRTVKHYRDAGFDDEKIISLTGNKSGQWLRNIDKIISLDEKSYSCFCNDQINLSVAQALAEIDDLEERHILLDFTIKFANARSKEKVERAKKALNKAEGKEEIAGANVAVANLIGTEEEKDSAVDGLEEASKNVEEKQDAVSQAEENKQAKATDLKRAISTTGTSGSKKISAALREAKIRKLYLNPLAKLIEQNGINEDGRLVVSIDSLNIAFSVVNGILTGKTDVVSVLKEFEKDGSSKEEQPFSPTETEEYSEELEEEYVGEVED